VEAARLSWWPTFPQLSRCSESFFSPPVKKRKLVMLAFWCSELIASDKGDRSSIQNPEAQLGLLFS